PFVHALVGAAEDPDRLVRLGALRALRFSGVGRGHAAVPASIAALSDSSDEIRIAAIACLADLGAWAEDAIAPLTQLERDPRQEIRMPARRARLRIEAEVTDAKKQV